MKFGQKQTVSQKAKMVEDRRNGRPVKTKDIAPVAKPKIKPSGTNPLKGKVGVKATWKF